MRCFYLIAIILTALPSMTAPSAAQTPRRTIDGWTVQDLMVWDGYSDDPGSLYAERARWNGLAAADTLHLITCGRMTSTNILKMTSDGGKTWRVALADTANLSSRRGFWRAVAHPVPALAIAVGLGHDMVARSTDGGATWTKPSYPELSPKGELYGFSAISMCDSLHGLIWGTTEPDMDETEEVILRTADGGATWHPLSPPTTALRIPPGGSNANLLCLSPTVYVGTGYDGYGNQVIARSEDAGATWSPSPPIATISQMAFADPLHGFVVGDLGPIPSSPLESTYGFISRTTDGGRSWQLVLKDSATPAAGLTSIATTDRLHAIASGPGGKVLITRDGGEHWTTGSSLVVDSIFHSSFIKKVVQPSATKAWGVNDAGEIFAYDALGDPANGVKWEPPSRAHLEIRPDPVGMSGTISYDVARRGHLRITVADILGREVILLIDGLSEAGRHAIPFERASLASGPYLLLMELDGRVTTRRFIVE